MLEKLEKVETRYEEVQLRLCDPEMRHRSGAV